MTRNRIWLPSAAHNDGILDGIMTVSDDWKNNRDSIIARNKGIKEAKEHTLNETNTLLWIGKKLPYAVVFVSAIHIWESVARIAPGNVPSLELAPQVYYTAAFVFTIMIDVIAVFIQKAHSALAHTKVRGSNSIWFFYIITALLNAAFIAANSPDATDILKTTLVEWFGNAFLFLLPITIPIAIWGVEESNKKLEAFKVLLTVDIATLEGIITSSARAVTVEHKTVVINSAPPQITETVDTLQNVITNNSTADKVIAEKVHSCAKCGVLLPDTGNAKKNHGKWLSTHKSGCEMCNPKKSK